jgi:menaquinone-specific isochorismate synthase
MSVSVPACLYLRLPVAICPRLSIAEPPRRTGESFVAPTVAGGRLGLALVTAVPTTRLLTTAVTRMHTRPVDLIGSLARPTGALCFVGGGDGFAGWGVHRRFTATGPDAAARIQDWLADVAAELQVDDPVGVPGTGPIAFVSLGFDDSDVAVAVVPEVVLGRRDGIGFSTVIGPSIDGAGITGTGITGAGTTGTALPRPMAVRSPGRVSYADAELSVAGFTSAVITATARIRAGELEKVVLAHDLEATTARPIDERFLLAQLAAGYPDCWTFAVEGLVGASPELLIRRIGATISSRVLAGTAWREHSDDAVAAELMGSAKDIEEHEYAVRSVADVLAEVCVELDVPTAPVPLELANLTHLSTDITGRLDERAPSALDLAARLHPTAAVGGSPTAAARQVIRDLEPMTRGRYAAPVGWLDSSGDGEFAIALRCAQVNGRSVRLMAGCGIVADSDPETEAREAQIKMIPIRDALEARG